jgi:hypothetical protein
MLDDVLLRIERRLKATDQSANAASLAAGVSGDAIRNLRRAVKKGDRQGISTLTLTKLAPVLQTTVGWLLDGNGPEDGEGMDVPILGFVGANPDGSVIFSTGQAPGDRAPLPPGGSPSSSALEVRGHSLAGLADDEALIYFENQRTAPTPDMLNHVVVVELESGEILVKRLRRGSRPGSYDLESLAGPTIEDAAIVWAAHVTAIIPPWQARRMIRRAGEAA